MLRLRSSAISILLHALLLLVLCWLSFRPPVRHRTAAHQRVPLVFAPVLDDNGGGGGGSQSPTPASHGALPAAARTFVPPQAMVLNRQPKLVMPAAMDAPPELSGSAANIGDPNSLLEGLSGGPGGPRGIGNGGGPSIGPASGRDGDGTGSVFAVGHGVSMPVPIYKVDPEYSEMARRAKMSGTVLVTCIVDVDGKPRDLRVARGMGLGLDEKALEAVGQWVFRPGTKAGKPVPVRAVIEVSFRIL